MSRQLYRYRVDVRLEAGDSPTGVPYHQPIFIQIPADSIVEATQVAAGVGKRLGLLLVGPVGL